MRLSSFVLPEVQSITSCDTLELGKLGERKQAIFCVIPDSNDSSLNFLVGMLYTQAFQTLYYQADRVHGGSLPVPVRLIFDEFANVALPDGYARLQSTIRSRNVMSTIILQNIRQLKALFKDDWECIIGNADAFIGIFRDVDINSRRPHKRMCGLRRVGIKSGQLTVGEGGGDDTEEHPCPRRHTGDMNPRNVVN